MGANCKNGIDIIEEDIKQVLWGTPSKTIVLDMEKYIVEVKEDFEIIPLSF